MHNERKHEQRVDIDESIIPDAIAERANTPKRPLATAKQVGGDHYRALKIQPVHFCVVNNIPYLEATAIKYICRHKLKGGAMDVKKAIHFLELLLEYEYPSEPR